MFKTYIDNYYSKEYKDKLKNNKNDDYFYIEDDKEYYIKYKKIHVKIKKPEYIQIEDEISKLNNEKVKLLFDYNNLKYKIIHEINTESDYDNYSKIIDKLIKIDKKNDDLNEYYKKINRKNIKSSIENKKILKEINNEINILNNKFKNSEFKDDIDKAKEIEKYKKLIDTKKENTNNYYNTIDFIILKKPVIEDFSKINKNKKEKDKKEKDKKEKDKKDKINKDKKNKDKKLKNSNEDNIEQMKRYKLKEKIKEKNDKNRNKNNGEDIEKTIKKLEKKIKKQFFDEFNFKNEEECASGSYSSDYFTKKPQILKIINKYPDVKKLMSKGYNKKPKDEICKELYKL